MTDFITTGAKSSSSQFVEDLLYQSEGTALDFKEKQYPFNGATDEQKSELLKDILTFANSWRQGDAYILIGVQAAVGGRHIPVGTEEHFDDAQLQQFVNSKTNRKVILSYEVHLIEGKKIGVIRIPKQDRPIYATKRFGKVEKEAVYFRLGSSTVIAKPEDIARMGRDSIQSQLIPLLNLSFAALQNRTELGTTVEVDSIAYNEVTEPLPNAGEKRDTFSTLSDPMVRVNEDYWREMEQYVRKRALLKPVGLVIRNQSNRLAENVRVEISGSSIDGIAVMDESELPTKPAYRSIDRIPQFKPFWKQQQQQITVEHHGKGWSLTAKFGNVQPKSYVWASEPFYVGSMSQNELKFEAFIYADNLPEPQKVPLIVRFNIILKPALTLNELRMIED
jgi:hypothetical protein